MEYSKQTEHDLLALLTELGKRITELDAEREEVLGKMQAINLILPIVSPKMARHILPPQEILSGPNGKPPRVEPIPFRDVASLRGMKQYPALKAIARFYGGFVRTLEAKDLMVQAGILKDGKNSYKMVYNLIKNSEEFTPTDVRGEYYLTEKQPSL
jgi:hypothetical protein